VVVTTFDTANFRHTTNAASSALDVTLRVDTGVHKKSINFQVPLGQTLWNQIWSVHGQFNSDDRYSIGRADLTLDKYSISFRGTAAGAQNAVMVAIRPDAERDTEMRFRGSNQQGLVDQRFRITFASPDIQVNFPVARDIVRVNWVFVEFFYERPYTPAILAQDRRDRDPVRRTSGPDDEIETVWDPFSDTNMPASLAMKPAGDAVVTPGEIRVNVNLTLRGGLLTFVTGGIFGLAAFLGVLGLTFMASSILALAGVISAGITAGPVGVAAAALAIVVLSAMLVLAVPNAIERKIREAIADNLKANSTRRGLNQAGILTYAGEGLAEGIAQQVIAAAVANGTLPASEGVAADPTGRSRFRRQFWQMIHVTRDACRVLIRRSTN